jgi:hypothetical protein
MHKKLIDLGWAYPDGKIQIIDPETEEINYHVR